MGSEAAPSHDTSSGAVIRTLLVTDLVESTDLTQQLGDQRAEQLSVRHDRTARDLLTACNGLEIDKSDGFLLLFERPIDAVRYALAYHASLEALSAQVGVSLRARVGIHLGEVRLRENAPEDVRRGAKPLEVEGIAKPIAARLMSLAGARQTLLTRAAFDLARRASVDQELSKRRLRWLAHGPYLFKGVQEPLEVFEVGEKGLAALTAPTDTGVARRAVTAGDEIALGWRPAAGLEIPRRPSWILEEKLGQGGFGEVWLAEHKKMAEKRVFKFCFEAPRLRGLRREVSLFRLLRDALGHRDDIARVLDWDFEEAPYFLEVEYTDQGDLVDWVAAQGGFGPVPLSLRLELIAQVADALGAAHSVGVLHKDVKPTNVLIAADRGGDPRAVLTDFGIGLVVDPSALEDRGITAYGLTESASSGTQLYAAPELLEGKVATVQADIYALGVTLYQFVVGDFRHALAPGWERDIDDDVLREDIALLVDGVPEERCSSTLEVAKRLRSLEERRRQREEERRARLAAERARRRRRLTVTIASLAVATSLVVSVFALQTVRANRLAEQRRGQAEDLIQFMLGDLRAKLEAVGRLDVLDDVGDAALEYFSTIPSELYTAEELSSRSQALYQIGDVRLRQGDLRAARPAFEESLRLAVELNRRDPANADWLFGLGQSEFWVGRVAWERGDLGAALEHFSRYLSVSESLVALDPIHGAWQQELAYAHGNIGSVLEARGDLEGALEAYRASGVLKEELVEEDPSALSRLSDLADTRNKTAAILQKLGDLEAGVREYGAELAIRRTLAEADPENMDWKYRLALSHLFLGEILVTLGRGEEAQEHKRTALDLFAELNTRDPSNVDWQRGLAASHHAFARGEVALGILATNDGLYRALAIYDRLSEQDPANPEWRRRHATVLVTLARAELGAGRSKAAIVQVTRAVETLGKLVVRVPSDRLLVLQATEAHRVYGEVLSRMGRGGEALQRWSRALVLVDALGGDKRSTDVLSERSFVLLHLNRLDQARPLVEDLFARGYRYPEWIKLVRARGLLP